MCDTTWRSHSALEGVRGFDNSLARPPSAPPSLSQSNHPPHSKIKFNHFASPSHTVSCKTPTHCCFQTRSNFFVSRFATSSSSMSLAFVEATVRISPLFSTWILCAHVGLHLENVFSVFCGLAVEHSWHMPFQFTEVQLFPSRSDWPVRIARLNKSSTRFCSVSNSRRLENDFVGLLNTQHLLRHQVELML